MKCQRAISLKTTWFSFFVSAESVWAFPSTQHRALRKDSPDSVKSQKSKSGALEGLVAVSNVLQTGVMLKVSILLSIYSFLHCPHHNSASQSKVYTSGLMTELYLRSFRFFFIPNWWNRYFTPHSSYLQIKLPLSVVGWLTLSSESIIIYLWSYKIKKKFKTSILC